MTRTLPPLGRPTRPPRDRMARRLMLAAAAGIAGIGIGLAAVAASGPTGTGPTGSQSTGGQAARGRPDRLEPYDEAIAAPSGVRPLVTDRAGELGTIVRIEVKHTPDVTPAPNHLLAPIGEQRAALAVISDPDLAEIALDGMLADGRPYQVFRDEGPYVSLRTFGVDGQLVELVGRDMTFDELVALAGEITVTRSSLERLPAGWALLGTVPMPPWIDGFLTNYDYLGGRRLGVTVEPAHDDREMLAAFATADPIVLATGGWAYLYRAPASGMVFELGDAVVTLSGDFSEAELLVIAHSLRPMASGEHPLLPADTF